MRTLAKRVRIDSVKGDVVEPDVNRSFNRMLQGRTSEELLLDLHLGLLDDDTRAILETELLSNPELRAKRDRLASTLRPLDSWETPEMPSGLPEKVLEAVRSQRETSGSPQLEYVASTEIPTESGGDYQRSWAFSFKELLAAAACILLLVSVMVPGISGARRNSQKAVCGAHLGSIGEGVALYQQANGSLPYAGSEPGAAWLDSAPEDAPRLSNSRHLFLVIRSGMLQGPDVLTCPADENAKPMSVSDLSELQDFPSASNISFDSLNMNGDEPPIEPGKPIVYLSDRNPLFLNGRFDDSVDPDSATSPSHRQLGGQNMLTLDNSVHWQTSPLWGPKLDNIWLAGSIRQYFGTESQVSPDDAFLVPGCPTTNDDPTVASEGDSHSNQ